MSVKIGDGMEKFFHLISSVAIILLLLSGCKGKEVLPEFSGPYFGQTPPGNSPMLFMPGLISTNYIDHCTAFLNGGRVCVFSIWEKGTFYMFEIDGHWTQATIVPWQNEQGTTDFTAGPDDYTIYFQSRRATNPEDKNLESNIWKVEWKEAGWTEPVPLPSPANTEEFSELYPSVAPDGSVYFFTGSRSDSHIADIYRSKFSNGKYHEAERLPDPINSDYYEVDPVVAPDGSYLLFGSARPGGFSIMDLYTSFHREDGTWSPPINTGPDLNPFCIPTRMSVTPDGRYFFFPSSCDTDFSKGEDYSSANIEKWGDYDVYWVSTGFIDDLRDQCMKKKSAAAMIELEYREKGIQSATNLLNELYTTQQNGFYFELSEFLVMCGDLITAGRVEESERLYAELLESIPEEIRIRQGYAVACILNGQAAKGLDLMKELWTEFPSAKPVDRFMINFQLRRKSRKEDELSVLQFFTHEFPDSGLAYFWLAEAQEHYGNIEEALKNCLKALELNPDFEDAVNMRNRLSSKLLSPNVSKNM
jgi:tetratricopeptide (TPR) repeat protein